MLDQVPREAKYSCIATCNFTVNSLVITYGNLPLNMKGCRNDNIGSKTTLFSPSAGDTFRRHSSVQKGNLGQLSVQVIMFQRCFGGIRTCSLITGTGAAKVSRYLVISYKKVCKYLKQHSRKTVDMFSIRYQYSYFNEGANFKYAINLLQ